MTLIDDASLTGIERRSAIDAVRMRIGVAIRLGLLKPGERLPDKEEVALGLSVSPMTARRALASLADDGVVVRLRGRGGGTFVAEDPPAEVLRGLTMPASEFSQIHRLIDRRMLFETSVGHFAALNASEEQLWELEALTARMAATSGWAEYHQADAAFHELVGQASGLGAAVEEYQHSLDELYAFFVPYPIEQLHVANRDHAALTEAFHAKDAVAAAAVSRKHVETLHRTMVVGLLTE
ncbi:FadR/GntR family transcriptional regulator [Sinomonas terrae]|uniref:FCD domain-containing protein n=1 Tax=Sinomonas terrae TaxID=2908838 RepID=A0ABS9U7J4_9MICC|nr:FCD domain-containing protein [Sinomonas terrae]MCH6472332.1 FCD domain-containing protein [Sinomonas terrae]